MEIGECHLQSLIFNHLYSDHRFDDLKRINTLSTPMPHTLSQIVNVLCVEIAYL